MTPPDEAFLELLRSTFRVEAREHLHVLSTGLLELEGTSGAEAERIIERVFRAAHTLKGAARAADFREVESLCGSLEETFVAWKRREALATAEALDQVHRTLDRVTAMLAPAPIDEPARELTVRVSFAKLEEQLVRAEEALVAKLAAGQRAADLSGLASRIEEWRKVSATIGADLRELRASATASSSLTRVLDFFDWTQETLKTIETSATALGRTADQDRQTICKVVDDLLEDSKKLLLLPFSTISATFPKLIRDLTRDQGKDAELVIHGDDVQIDKRILEEIKDPILHLLRNSVDHGIETPDQRMRRGKPARATIAIAVSQVNGNKVQVALSDDGAGIDLENVRESAIRRGVIGAEEAKSLADSDVQRLIFRSEVTTSRAVTQVSGRGLGLAIVEEKAEKLGGDVHVESQPGAGTTFRIIVPSTRATFRGILVEAGGGLLVVPTMQVERVSRVVAGDIHTVEGQETISFEGRAVSLVRLSDVLGIPGTRPVETPSAGASILILGAADQRVAFLVDAVLDEQEVLVRPLRPPLVRVKNVAAATVLGSGQVAVILNVSDLLKSARTIRRPIAAVGMAKTPDARLILVAEDSITSRVLLRSILESAGYRVKTAIDGMEALLALRSEHFDLVVTDVEMPRLSGFDLTARIRADPKLADLPVVLVTALETREDRERGIDAGANAYIVKGSFDQSDLLEAVRRLI